jgi:5-methylcytosine-specific restriction endonuclease McrA
MPTCKICLRTFNHLRFRSERICVCGRCVNSINGYREVAEASYKELGDLLRSGMLRSAHVDTAPHAPQWRQDRAQRRLANFEIEFSRELPEWINTLVANPENRRKTFKIVRAHRRGLLHFDRPHGWGYPANWPHVAARIRQMDEFACLNCGARDTELHVHHIIYASNFGTHQQQNLVTLCRGCHEAEHERVFDFGENLVAPDGLPAT